MAAPISELAIAIQLPETAPEPPDHLSVDQKAIWNGFYTQIAVDWIAPESLHLLEALCVHISNFRRIKGLIASSEVVIDRASAFSVEEELGIDPPPNAGAPDVYDLFKHHNQLLTAMTRETKQISQYSTKLRLTTQSLRSADHSANSRSLTNDDVSDDY